MKIKALVMAVVIVGALSACTMEMSISANDEDPDAPGGPLYTVASAKASGGMCPDGECTSEVEILSDGRVIAKNGTDRYLGAMSKFDLSELQDAVEDIDMTSLPARGADYTCPVAYDGQKVVFSFYGDEEPKVIDSCEHDPTGLQAVDIVTQEWEAVVAKD